VILALNCGSSSLKYAVFDGGVRVRHGKIERIGVPGGHETHTHAVNAALDAIRDLRLDAAGHRLVHGGPSHHEPSLVDVRLLASLRSVVRFAPLHLPPALAAIDAVSARLPDLPQVACFDTDFHWNMPEVARRLPLPADLHAIGVRRYGFHGLSYESVLVSVPDPGRAVIAHLGNGASMCAVRDGRSIDTTMGFTPSGGLMMGTRAGDLDPGVLVFLMQDRGYAAREIERLVDHDSGLAGVSGTTSDMQTLLGSSDARARLAVEMFCHIARKFIGALAAELGGIDSLIFTGGIGEHAAEVRDRICAGLSHLGVYLDSSRNARSEQVISNGPCTVHIVAADEERVIAAHASRFLPR
jgi:acetate kinase